MSKEQSFDAEDPVRMHHLAHAASGPQSDPVRQSSGVQPSRSRSARKASSRSRDDIEKELEGLEPEPIRPRSPTIILPAAVPIIPPEKPEPIPSSHEPSASHRLREPSYDRSNSFPLPDAERPVFISPPVPSAPQMPAQDYYFGGRPEPMPYVYNPYDAGIRFVPQPSREMPYTQSAPQPSREMPYIRSAAQPSREMPYIRSVAQPSREMPYAHSTPQPSREMPYIRPAAQPSREMPYAHSTPQPSREMPFVRSAPQPSRQMPSNVYDSGPHFVPPRPSLLTPYAAYSRARRGDAFIANDPFRPSVGKNERDTYESFDDMPMPTDATGPIVMPPPHVIPSQPIMPSQPPVMPPIIPSQPPVMPPVIPPQAPVIPSRPPIVPYLSSQPPIIYPSDPYSSQRPQSGWYRPTMSARPSSPVQVVTMHPSPDSDSIPSAPPSRPPTPPDVYPEHPAQQLPELIRPRPSAPSPVLPRIPTPASSVSVDDIPGTEEVPNDPLTPIRRPEDPGIPIPSEYPNGYEPYFQEHGIHARKKFSFWSAFQKLFTWPFARPDLKPSPEAYSQPPYSYPPYPPGFIPETYYPDPSFTQIAGEFVTKTMPTQVYSYFLLRLPSLYFSRVARIFEEADLTLPEIKKMALETASKDMVPSDDFYAFEFANVSPQYTRLKTTWESFIDSVLREWKTFNIISVLLLSAILTILQIQSAEQDPIIRYTALASLICALISLLFGCMYIIRFGTMRKTYKAAEWAFEAKRTRTTVWWNVWVLLAMPVIWLVWSIILYLACIMTFIWRTTSQDVSPPLIMSETTVLIIRVVLSSVLGLGILYATLIMSTFRRYGETMDKAWKRRISGWIDSKTGNYGPGQPGPDLYNYLPPSMQPYPPGYPYPYVPEPGSPSIPPATPNRTRSWDREYDYPPDRKPRYPEPYYSKQYAAPSIVPEEEESRYPSRRESEISSTSTSAYRPFFNSQEPLRSSLRPPRRDTSSTGRQSVDKEQDDGPSSSLPPPVKAYIPPADHPKGARKKRRVSVPPATTLPTIPGTPGSSSLSYLTPPVFTDSPPSIGSLGLDDQNGATPDSGEVEPTRPSRRESRVQFRSPLVSAQSTQDTSRTGSEQNAMGSTTSSISGATDYSTGVPWTPFPSPISRDP